MNTKHARDGRLFYFDGLRFLLVAGVVLLHAACGYSRFVPWWFLTDGDSAGADLILAVLDVFLMPLLFFIAGYFAPLSLAGKGAAGFLKSKARRLLIPFWLLTLFYLPILPYLSHTVRGERIESFFAYWLRSLAALGDFHPHLMTSLEDAGRFQDVLSPHLLWFLSLLFLFFAGYAAVAGLGKGKARPDRAPGVKGFWTVWISGAILMSLAMAALASSMPVMTWFKWNAVLLVQPVRAPLYLGMFALGVVSASRGWLRERPFPGPSWLWLTGAVLSLAGVLAVSGGVQALAHPGAELVAAYAVFRVLANICLIVWCCNVFRRRLNRPTRLGGFLAAGSYDVYLLHMPLTVFVEILLMGAPLSPVVKLSLAFILAVSASLCLSAALVRPRPKLALALLLAFFLSLCLFAG